MIRIRPLLPVCTMVLLAAAACDTSTSPLLTPVVESETSFEDGLGPWTLETQVAAIGGGAVVLGDASEGSSYLEVLLASPGDVVWVEQVVVVEGGASYNVTLSADARAIQGDGELVYAAAGRDLGAGDLQPHGPAATAWRRELMPGPATADAQGRIWVAVGVRSSGSMGGTIGLDRVGVVLTREQGADG